ncbi:MAG: DUF1614 domain-containing protein [Syntrophorhabdales bacterium]|jgi:uncharacterized membrane protein
MHYFPVAFPFLLFFAIFLVALIIAIEIGILRYAYERMGVGSRHMFALLLLTFFGSYVNIPLFYLPAQNMVSDQIISLGGMRYVIPQITEWPGTVVAVNLGGAVIPVLLSLYLLVKNRLFFTGLAGVAIVTVVVHLMAYPVRGVGIAEPVLTPPLISAAVGLLLSRQFSAPLAYVAGSMGTLLGADILNLGKIQGLGAPVASIGGAGTFDGIFLTGIVSVLLVSLVRKKGPVKGEGDTHDGSH